MLMYAFEHLPDDSPLCRFLTDLLCRHAGEETWENIGTQEWESACEKVRFEIPVAFFRKVLQRYTQCIHSEITIGIDLGICDCHEHKDDAEREACASKRAAWSELLLEIGGFGVRGK